MDIRGVQLVFVRSAACGFRSLSSDVEFASREVLSKKKIDYFYLVSQCMGVCMYSSVALIWLQKPGEFIGCSNCVVKLFIYRVHDDGAAFLDANRKIECAQAIQVDSRVNDL